MAAVTRDNLRPTDNDLAAPYTEVENPDDIVIVRLDHSMAYAVPTWCASSPTS
ncbi:hypothetical protein ACFQ07_31735 [Actinomadura adrarensis]|uniref:Uncharacterized protein n=1 Tax=Actinomadura adrarensis TaxID=1819600 RepID=A0ABW3CTG1_9ACTN